MTTRALFFDMDNTLIDGYGATASSWAVVCNEEGIRLGVDPDDLLKKFRAETREFWRDEGAAESWRVRLDDARAMVIERVLLRDGLDHSRAHEISHRYAELHRENLALYQDAVPTLLEARAAGYRLGLITNGPSALQRDKIERFDLARYFDVMVIEGEFGCGKPHREVFDHALDSVDVRANEAWHIGDNLYADIGGAKGAGLRAAWIHRGHNGRAETISEIPGAAHPDVTIAHLSEAREALGL